MSFVLHPIVVVLLLGLFLALHPGCCAMAFSMTSSMTTRMKTTTPASTTTTTPTTPTTTNHHHHYWCLIDVENVRGKTNFQERHEDFMGRIHHYHSSTILRTNNHTSTPNTTTTTVLVMDHGTDLTVQTILPGMMIVFAGPHQKADQVLKDLCQSIPTTTTTTTNSSSSLGITKEIQVISSDRQVVEDCLKAHCATTIVEPVTFLKGLVEKVPINDEFMVLWNSSYTNHYHYHQNNNNNDNPANNNNNNNNKPLTVTQALQKEVAAKQEVQMLKRLLNPPNKKKKLSRKQRTKLNHRHFKAQERLNRLLLDTNNGRSVMDSILSSGENIPILLEASTTIAKQIRRGVGETTYERQLLAERLRRTLLQAVPLLQSATALENNDQVWSEIVKQLTMPSPPPSAAVVVEETTTTTNHHHRRRYRLGQAFPYNPDTRNCLTDSMEQILTVRTNHGEYYRQKKQNKSSTTNGNSLSSSSSLRMLVMSDTHGMEGQLFSYIGGSSSSTAGSQQQQQQQHFFHKLPDADVLIHCGDFYGQRSKLKQLDQFLAAQTHIPTKIIVRGNHDPKSPSSVLFPKSKSLFVTKPSTLCFNTNNNDDDNGSIVVALRPHSRQYDPSDVLPPNCDILLTHEPPFGILDYCYSGQRAGSTLLRHIVEQSKDKPALWLCGHIHEGRGVAAHTFVPNSGTPTLNHSKHHKKKKKNKKKTNKTFLSQQQRRAILSESSSSSSNKNSHDDEQQSTLIVNVASANEGKARSLVNGPVLIDFLLTNDGNDTTTTTMIPQESWTPTNNNNNKESQQPQLLLRHDSLEAMKLANDAATSKEEDDEKSDHDTHPNKNCLLSVDLGLRTGIAIFNATGFIMDVQSLRFDNHSHLSDWIEETLLVVDDNNKNHPKITHVVLEGQDPEMVNLWRKALLPKNIPFARVVAEEWRRSLLSRKEQRDARKSKQAASLIAQQLLHRYYRTSSSSRTTMDQNKKLSPDAAEALLLGHYAVRVLKWVDSTTAAAAGPVVQRYTNGDIVVPKLFGRKQQQQKK